MKNVKRDSKYIIKRILIGVGIALILANLRKCNVYADEIPAICFDFSNASSCNISDNRLFIDIFENNVKVGSDILDSTYNNNLFAFKNNNNDYVVFSDKQLSSVVNDRQISEFGFIQKKINNNNAYTILYSSNVEDIKNNNLSLDYNIPSGNGRFMFISLDSNRRNEFYNNFISINGSSYVSKFDILYNNINYYVVTSLYGYSNYFFNPNDWSYLYSVNNFPNLDTSTFYYVDSNFNITNELESSPDISQNFSEIDISDYQAVYFVPKNYNTIPTRLIDNTKFIDFNFYYKGNINKGYFNIKNNSQVVFSPPINNDNSENEFSYIEGSFPYYYDERVSHDVSAYIIYNTGNNTLIRYDSSLFDYYLVKDLSDYADEIIYINENGEQVSDYISFTKTLQNQWEQGFINGGDSWVDNSYSNNGSGFDKIKSYLELAKLPFTFWKKMMSAVYSNTCEPLEVPMPMVSGTIRLQCLSTIFNNVLTVNVYSYFKKIVNIVYIILICLSNVKFLMITLSPRLDTEAIVDINEGGL